jgi:hypothetical protein
MKKTIWIWLSLMMGIFFYTSSFGQSVVWPLAPQDSIHQIWGGYGQFDGEVLHFHEGVDLPADSGTAVLAAAPGKIVELDDDGGGYYSLMTVSFGLGSTEEGWGYIHTKIGSHRVQARSWQLGDTVALGDTLGTIVGMAGIMPHLHFEHSNDDNGYDTTGVWRTPPDLNGNPLEFLTPNGDTDGPVILPIFEYREGAGEGKSNAQYFYEDQTASGLWVIKDNIDIIAPAWERYGEFFTAQYDISVKKIEFEVDELNGPGDIPCLVAEDFSGLFLSGASPDEGRNTWNKMRDSSLVNVIYENDNTCDSDYRALDGTEQPFLYYILTNRDDDEHLELSDSSRYWDTDGKQGEPWNDNRDAADHEADRNADAAFPDGEYEVTVRVTGHESPPDIEQASQTIFVNNHDETIESCDDAGATKNYFKPKDKVYVRGEGFPKSRSFTVYLVLNTDWIDGMSIAGIITTTAVTTTDSGTIDPTQVWDEYAPNGSPDQGYDMILDYDDDEKYTASKEGFIVEAMDDADVEYNAGLRSKKPKVVVTTAGHTHLRLTWTEPWDSLGIQRYIIQRSTDPYDIGDTLDFTYDTTYTDQYVTGNPYYNYFYTVSAENVVGEQVWQSDRVGEFDKELMNEMK